MFIPRKLCGWIAFLPLLKSSRFSLLINLIRSIADLPPVYEVRSQARPNQRQGTPVWGSIFVGNRQLALFIRNMPLQEAWMLRSRAFSLSSPPSQP